MAGNGPDRTRQGVLRMAAPLVVSFWMRSLFTFVDTIYASTLGDPAVAAIGLSIPIEFLMIAIWVGLSNSLTSHLSRAMGAREGAKIQQYLRASWTVVLVIVPVFALVGAACWFFADAIAPPGAVAEQFAIYGAVLVGGSAFTMFWSVIPDSIIKAHHDTRATMWAGIWSNVINVILNTIFTFVFHWGIFGIAFSTVIGRVGGLIYALRRAAAHEAVREARGEDTAPGVDPSPIRTLLALAVPSALTYCLMSVESGIVNRILAGLPSATEAIAAYAIQYRLLQFALMPAIAIAAAMLPFAARRFGERDVAGVRRGLLQAHMAAIAYTAILTPIFFYAAAPISGALTSSEITRAFATFGLRVVPLACLASLPLFLCRPIFEGLGRGRPGFLMALLRFIVLTAPSAWLGIWIAAAMGLPAFYGLVMGLIAAAALTSGIFVLWTRSLLTWAAKSSTHPAALAGSEA